MSGARLMGTCPPCLSSPDNDHNDADDVLQNTFLKVFENINNFKGNSSIYTWMFRIATNESLNYINKKAKKLDMPLIVRLEGTNSDIAKDIIDKAAIPGLISAVDLDDAAAKAVAAI